MPVPPSTLTRWTPYAGWRNGRGRRTWSWSCAQHHQDIARPGVRRPSRTVTTGRNGMTEDEAARERPLWFTHQVVGAADLDQWNRWAIERMRRHNRVMHGWGLVFGTEAKVAKTTQGAPIPGTVEVSPGLVLSPQGDEIALDAPVRVDVRGLGPAGGAGPLDPAHWYFLAVSYDEQLRGEVPKGCDEGTEGCEHTRAFECFRLGLLDTLPSVYTLPTPTGDHPPPPVTAEPWVVVAGVKVARSGTVTLDTAQRRFVPKAAASQPTPAAQPLTLTLAPSLVAVTDVRSSWLHDGGVAGTRKKEAFDGLPMPGVGVTSAGMMSVVLPENSLISKLKVSGVKSKNQRLTVTLTRKEIKDSEEGQAVTLAEVIVPTEANAMKVSFGFEDAQAEVTDPALARVENQKYRYFIVARATKTTDASDKVTDQAVLRHFRIVCGP
ncbi:hypothetical protein [Streptomyces sp. NPDC000410]|uniref:hypothetical protein n=1 Tax=Streptomyces sp. NPDC000410 TaxID=3154254 RepID=UPI00332D68C3